MPKRTWPTFAAQLMAAGLPADTTALLAESVSTPAQTILWSTVQGLAVRLAGDPGTAAALIVYGPLAEGDG